jgi:radical SAM protein with 4Fe4S-binding SPASM domain
MRWLRPKAGLLLEVTNACNMRCDFCPTGWMTRPRGFMAIELAEKALREASEGGVARSVCFWLMGEPVLHPKLFEMFALARRHGMAFSMSSNGLALDAEMAARLFREKPATLALSVHSYDADSFARRHAGGARWEDYRRRVEDVIEQKFATGSKTHIEVLMMSALDRPPFPYNPLATEPLLEEAASEWFALADRLRALYGLPRRRVRFPTARELRATRSAHLLPGVTLRLPGPFTWQGDYLPVGASVEATGAGSCSQPFSTCGVLWNGDVTFCCNDYDGRLVVGNVGEERLDAIWYGERMERVRRNMAQGVMPAVCRRCKGDLRYEREPEVNGSESPLGNGRIARMGSLARRLVQMAVDEGALATFGQAVRLATGRIAWRARLRPRARKTHSEL